MRGAGHQASNAANAEVGGLSQIDEFRVRQQGGGIQVEGGAVSGYRRAALREATPLGAYVDETARIATDHATSYRATHIVEREF